MAARPVVEVRGLWKSFGDKEALRGVDLKLHDGETLVVLGPSGCGKSVLLKHVIGLMEPDRGSIIVEGRDLSGLSQAELNEIRQKFGMVFQGAALFDSMTVGDNVALPLREHRGMKGERLSALVEEKLELVGLKGISSLRPAELSGGMKKRVALARAIALDPDIILYDEPTTGLDPVMAEQINELIRSTQRKLNASSIVVTHDLHSACFTGDMVALMDEGRIAFYGTTDELTTTENEAVRNFIARGHPAATGAPGGSGAGPACADDPFA
ncbi:MAG: ATP-binding cassette domain-containing protein [Candidatus Eisenbacteria bacterium]|nr:ATP-binding cassette domain-containing protein [Candidatus Eisenbacteria bacterium]